MPPATRVVRAREPRTGLRLFLGGGGGGGGGKFGDLFFVRPSQLNQLQGERDRNHF